MKVTSVNNVKIYNVNTGRSVPQWISEKKKRKLLKDDTELRQRIQLLQDFEMPTASTRIKMTPDQQHIMATGVYKPRVRCYETSELAMKFERAMDCEVVQFQILSDDWRKMVFLQADRHIEFHAQFGRYFRTRVPKHGRDITYHSGSAELYIVGASSDIWRLNLEEGRFMASLPGNSAEFNVCKINPVHQLITAGSTSGTVEAWDPRSRTQAAILNVTGSSPDRAGAEVTALRYHQDGLNMAVGLSNGEVLVYDIRACRPSLVKDHQYGFPIKDIKFHSSGNVISTDTKIIKIWDRNTGSNFTTIEPEADINDTCVPDGTGLIMTANEHKNMNAYFIPELGPAPKWCHFLDTIAEELEESEQTVMYDDYKFVTKAELEQLGLGSLVGSKLLRAYMHGFFMDTRLYNKAKAIAEPFAYEQYRKDAIKKKIEEKRANRIGLVKKLPKINKEYAAALLAKGGNQPTADGGGSVMADDRFGALFKNPDFTIDTQSEEFKQRHPAWSKEKTMSQFQPADDQDESEPEGRGSDEDTESEDESSSEDEQPAKGKKSDQVRANGPKMYELKEDMRFTHDGSSLTELENRNKLRQVPLGARIAKETVEPVTAVAHVGGQLHTFEYNKKRDLVKEQKEKERQQQLREHMKERKEARRGVRDLKLKGTGPVYWRGKRVDPYAKKK